MSTFANNVIHIRFGQRGVAIIAPTCHLISYIILACHPPYSVLVVFSAFVGFGNGILDAAWCVWMGNMANANEVSGFQHSMYAIGAAISPVVATALFSQPGLHWYSFYYLMVRHYLSILPFSDHSQIGISSIELVSLATTFWNQTGPVYRKESPSISSDKSGRQERLSRTRPHGSLHYSYLDTLERKVGEV